MFLNISAHDWHGQTQYILNTILYRRNNKKQYKICQYDNHMKTKEESTPQLQSIWTHLTQWTMPNLTLPFK